MNSSSGVFHFTVAMSRIVPSRRSAPRASSLPARAAASQNAVTLGLPKAVSSVNTVTFRRRVSKVAKPSGAGKLVATRTVSSGLPATMSWSRVSRHRQVC